MFDLDALTDWASQNPELAAGLVFLIAFVDGLLVIGSVVPAIPLLFALGALIGLGVLDPWTTLGLAALGAFCGDGLSYLIGRRYGDRLASVWPFSRRPQWLEAGRKVFDRHGSTGIVIGRFVGALRPFIPAIAGMLRLPPARYLLASSFAAVGWSLLFIAPGWLFGSLWQQLQAVAGPVLVIVLGLAILLWALWFAVTRAYRWLAPRGTGWLGRGLHWSRQHPHLGRLTRGLIDPTAPESTSLLLLALLLLGLLLTATAAWLTPGWQAGLGASAWQSLRSPWSDALVRPLLALAHPWWLAGVLVAGLIWAAWQRSVLAAVHCCLALAGGLLIDLALFTAAPGSPLAALPLSLPASLAALLALVAIIVAREARTRHPARPYLLAATWHSLYLFALLYFQISQALPAVLASCFGASWGIALGLAFRNHSKTFPGTIGFSRAASLALVGVLLICVWRDWAGLKSQTQLATHNTLLARNAWWNGEPPPAPKRSRPAASAATRATSMDLQYAGSLVALERHLSSSGWQRLPAAHWSDPLQLLNRELSAESLPILPLARDGFGELSRWQRGADSERQVLFIWPTRWRLAVDLPVLRVQLVRHRIHQYSPWLRLWLPERSAAGGSALLPVIDALPPATQTQATVAGWRAIAAAAPIRE